MTNRSYQTRGSVSRSVLITVRVSPEDRERLNEIAQERGETLSRMLLARWLPERKRTGREAVVRSAAASSVAVGASARGPKPAAGASESPAAPRPAERKRDVGEAPTQGSLFDGLGGR